MAFRGLPTFPYVIDLTWHTNEHFFTPVDRLLRALEQFPVLESVSITFCADVYTDSAPPVVTLPYLREMSLSISSDVRINTDLKRVLESLRLPNLTSLCASNAGVGRVPRAGLSCYNL